MKFSTTQKKNKNNWTLGGVILLAIVAGLLVYPAPWNKGTDWVNEQTSLGLPHFPETPFQLGLDLQGGTHLVYEADLSGINTENPEEAMAGVRDVIERRVNIYGVTEPVVQTNKKGDHYRLIVELAGIKDVNQAIEMIGQTPALDFREERTETEKETWLEEQKEQFTKELTEAEIEEVKISPYYTFKPTQLTGRYLEEAQVTTDQMNLQFQVGLKFDDEGADLFKEITERNIGKRLAIFLDGVPISAPTVQEAIVGGEAQITGDFSQTEARELVQRLNAGALPVPIKLVSQQTVGASLGRASLDKSLEAGLWGFFAILLFMIIFYRLPGLLASIALIIYLCFALALFKLVSVTLTLAGIAGFILSIGLAVDANVLIFARFKEELKKGKSLGGSIDDGFARAWSAIRDGNISTLITCLILFVISSGLIKGFALTLGIGVVVSMFTALIITKALMKWFVGGRLETKRRLWG